MEHITDSSAFPVFALTPMHMQDFMFCSDLKQIPPPQGTYQPYCPFFSFTACDFFFCGIL